MKRASIIIALLLFVVVGAFALDATVTWSWSKNDPDVEFFRYQVDGEEDGAWIVVDDSVLAASFDLDVSVEHTLYLQQSYDGENWSESSHAVSAAVDETPNAPAEVEASETPEADQPAQVVEEVPAVEAEQSEPVAEQPAEQPAAVVEETPVVEPVVAAKPDKVHYPAQSRIDLGAVYGNTIPFKTDKHLVGASVGYTLLFGRSSAFGLGLKAQATAYTDFDMIKDLKNATIMGAADLMLVANVSASWCDIYLGLGGEVIAPVKNLSSYLAGVVGQIGIRAKLSNVFGLGLEVTDSYILYPEAARMNKMDNINAKAYLSFQF